MGILSKLRRLLAPGSRAQGAEGSDAQGCIITPEMIDSWRQERAKLEEDLRARPLRVAVVKQDVCEDLYCCPNGTSTPELLRSTLLRTGPVALFTKTLADFHIVTTEADPECQVWAERATILKWDTLEFFASYRDRIPGRDYGQGRYASDPAQIDWGSYDLVVSIDVAVPARITRQYPRTAWSYYVREVKSPSYPNGLKEVAPGYDLFLNHGFRLHRPQDLPSHVVEFPYHLHYYGCFHEVFDEPLPTERSGVFVDHHTMVKLNQDERARLTEFGHVASTIHEDGEEIVPTSQRLARRTMDEDLRRHLMSSRYFLITPGQRKVHGTALVEAIAAGCLAIGSPGWMATHGFMFSEATSAQDTEAAIACMRRLNADPELFQREVTRQRALLDWLCYVRPLRELWTKVKSIQSHRS